MVPSARRIDDVEWILDKHLGDKLHFLAFIAPDDLRGIELIVNDVVRHRWAMIGHSEAITDSTWVI